MSFPLGARIVDSTNASSLGLTSEQPSLSCHGVASPWALSGWFGTISVQFSELAACAGVWVRLMAAPVGSTGLASARSGRPASGLTGGADALGLAVAARFPLAVALGHGVDEDDVFVGAADDGVLEVGVPEVGAPEVGAPEVGVPEVGVTDDGVFEVGATGVGMPEVGVSEVGVTDDGVSEVGVPDDGVSAETAAACEAQLARAD